jgi:hypothetical protein
VEARAATVSALADALVAAQRRALAAGGTCRLCGRFPVQYHHLVERDAPHFGDDVADNIVPLCGTDHTLVTDRHKLALYRLGEALTDAEYAYVIGKLGEDGPARLFGVGALRCRCRCDDR